MAEIKFHVKLPIFVARQWIRHRTASINEYSARYSVLDREFYLPEASQLKAQSSVNRQGRGEGLSPDEARHVLGLLREDGERTYANYAWMLNEDASGARVDPERDGLARELARINLTWPPTRSGIGKPTSTTSCTFLGCVRMSMLSTRSGLCRRHDGRDGEVGAVVARGL